MAGSMEYCQWRNSLIDMHDIRRRLDDTYSPDDIRTEEEREAYENVLEMCRKIADDFF